MLFSAPPPSGQVLSYFPSGCGFYSQFGAVFAGVWSDILWCFWEFGSVRLNFTVFGLFPVWPSESQWMWRVKWSWQHCGKRLRVGHGEEEWESREGNTEDHVTVVLHSAWFVRRRGVPQLRHRAWRITQTGTHEDHQDQIRWIRGGSAALSSWAQPGRGWWSLVRTRLWFLMLLK